MTRPPATGLPARREAPAFAGLDIVLGIEDEAWIGRDFAPDADRLEALVRRAAEAALAGAGLSPDVATELGVTLADDAAVKALNAEWRGKDGPTNVLSFPLAEIEPGEPPGPMLGDLVLARQTLLAEAEAEGKMPADHLIHLLVHGTLHCLGFDHVEADDAEAMEALETRILSGLGIADPYAALPDAALPGESDIETTRS